MGSSHGSSYSPANLAIFVLTAAAAPAPASAQKPGADDASDGGARGRGTGRYSSSNRVLDLNTTGATDLAGTTTSPGNWGDQKVIKQPSAGGGEGAREEGEGGVGGAGGGEVEGGGLRASSATTGQTPAAAAAAAGAGGGDWVGRREEGEPDVMVRQSMQRDKETEECQGMVKTLRVVPNVSWGRATKSQRERWDLLGCNGLIYRAERVAGGGGGGSELPDCTAR